MSKEEERPDPVKVAKNYHEKYEGKVAVQSKVPIRDSWDFNVWYTPGVAEPCKEIVDDIEKVYEYTNKGNMIAVVSDGTRVLGLGDIGPEPGLPVMEGKALLFKYLGGVDAVPICLDTKGEDKLVEIVKLLQPTFGGINLEDIEKPKCFSLLERLREELEIPVWHDDQQGTALVTLAGLMGALKVVGKKLEEIKLTVIGAGAAGVNNVKYAVVAGVKPSNIKIVDSRGILSATRSDLKEGDIKYEMARRTNPENLEGEMRDALKGADACVSATVPGPGIIEKEDIKAMNDDAIVFAMANPVPEILPEDAKEAGARIVGTGRGDYPNQVNNSLGFPGVFRGALDVAATSITDEMCISAANSIAKRAEELGLEEDFVIPDMGDLQMYVEEAVAVAAKAMKQGVARKEMSKSELREIVERKLKSAKDSTKLLMEKKFIGPP